MVYRVVYLLFFITAWAIDRAFSILNLVHAVFVPYALSNFKCGGRTFRDLGSWCTRRQSETLYLHAIMNICILAVFLRGMGR